MRKRDERRYSRGEEEDGRRKGDGREVEKRGKRRGRSKEGREVFNVWCNVEVRHGNVTDSVYTHLSVSIPCHVRGWYINAIQ